MLVSKKKLSIAVHSALVGTFSLCASNTIFAQDTGNSNPDVEEVVVTGSYIRNSAFTQNSPVDTVSQENLIESGNPSIGEYIRDLTYTQDTDVVGNPFGQTSGWGVFNTTLQATYYTKYDYEDLTGGRKDGLGQQFNVRFGVNNLTDRRPQRLPVFGGFESRLATPWGRQFYLSLEWNPGF